MKSLFVTADDYGLSPGVDDAILELLGRGRLSGTSCMSIFPEWQRSAARLSPLAGVAEIGLHLTLTDQPALSASAALAPNGMLPGLASLVAALALGRIPLAEIFAELDAQLAQFTSGLGRAPDFFDGHQHVHFLPPVRKWFAARQMRSAWLRGAASRPALPAMKAKAAVVRTLAGGFAQAMKKAGYAVRAPLDGFYDWKTPGTFATAMEAFAAKAPDGAVIMVHPGHPDALLKSRDMLTDARQAEYEALSSAWFAELLGRHGAALAHKMAA